MSLAVAAARRPCRDAGGRPGARPLRRADRHRPARPDFFAALLAAERRAASASPRDRWISLAPLRYPRPRSCRAPERRLAHYEAHKAYLGGPLPVQILISGPLLAEYGETMTGSLFIVEAPDRAAVDAFHAADPFRAAGNLGPRGDHGVPDAPGRLAAQLSVFRRSGHRFVEENTIKQRLGELRDCNAIVKRSRAGGPAPFGRRPRAKQTCVGKPTPRPLRLLFYRRFLSQNRPPLCEICLVAGRRTRPAGLLFIGVRDDGTPVPSAARFSAPWESSPCRRRIYVADAACREEGNAPLTRPSRGSGPGASSGPGRSP